MGGTSSCSVQIRNLGILGFMLSSEGALHAQAFGQMHMRSCFIVQVPFSQIFSRLHMHQMPPTDRSGRLGLARGLIGTMLTILLMQGKPEHQAGFHSCSARLETWHQSVKKNQPLNEQWPSITLRIFI